MLFIPFILSAGLDMSLPEFQPEADASGNYIVSSYDVSENEFSVEYIPAEDFAEVSLSPSAEVLEAPILRAIETHVVDSSIINSRRIIYQNGNYVINNKSGYSLHYVYLTAGIEYSITGSPNYTSSSLDSGTVVTRFLSSIITPSENLYLISTDDSFSVSYTTGEPDPEPDPSGNDPEPEDPSGNDPGGDTPSGGDFDDTNIIHSLNDLHQTVRALMFIVIIQFLYPLSMSIVRNIVGGDKNV